MKKILAFITVVCLLINCVCISAVSIYAEDNSIRYSDSATLQFSENFEEYGYNPTFTHSVKGSDAEGNASLSVVSAGIADNKTKVGMLDEPTYYTSDPTLTRHTDTGEIDSTARKVTAQDEVEYVRLDENFKDADHIRAKFKYYAAQHARKNGEGARDTLRVGFAASASRFSSNTYYVNIQNTTLKINNASTAISAKVKEWVEVEMDIVITGRGAGDGGRNVADITVTSLGKSVTYTTNKAGDANVFMMAIDNANGGRFYLDDISVYAVEDFPPELTEAAQHLSFSDIGNNQLQNEVTDNLSLMTEIDGYDVEWSSSNEKCLDNEGNVIRQPFNQHTVLTAKIIVSEKVYIEKDFDVTVVKTDGASDEQVMQAYADTYLNETDFTKESADAITTDLEPLPIYDEESGISISWQSDNEAIAIDSTVTRPAYDSSDAEVSLTAQLELNGKKMEKTLHYRVIKLLNPYTVINADMEVMSEETLTDHEDRDSVTLNLKLPTNGENGSSISWLSDKPWCISNDGTVVRGEQPTTVTMTATFEYGGVTKTKEFVFKVLTSVKNMIAADIAEINTSGWDGVVDGFELPLNGVVYGTEFSWNSQSEYLKISGEMAVVYRPLYADGDKTVTLTLYATNSNQTEVRTFNVKILARVSDEDAVKNAKSELTFESICVDSADDVSRNLSLISSIGDSVSVTWSSSDENTVSSSTGEIVKPAPGNEDKNIILTATLSKNYASDTKDFSFIVKAFENDDAVLSAAKDALLFSYISDEEIDSVTADLYLPKEWKYGTNIEWIANGKTIKIDEETGVVNRPEWGVTSEIAELTAKINYKQNYAEKKFLISVLEKDYMEVTEHVWDQNFDVWTMSDAQGEWWLPETEAEGTAYTVKDPTDSTNTVLKYDKYNAISGTGYITRKGNEGNGGIAVTQLRVYIVPEEREGKTQHWINVENITLNGSQAAVALQPKSGQFRVNTDIDGELTSLVTSAVTVETGKWYTIRFECNTARKTYNVFVDDKCVTENGMLKNASTGAAYDSTLGVAYTYTYDPSRPTAIAGFRFSMEAGGVAYIDDMSIDKKLVYTKVQRDVGNAWEREFLMKNNISALNTDLYLPKSTDNSIVISYSSSDTAVVTNSGVVTATDETKSINFTVSFTDDETSYTKHYMLTVGKNLGISDEVCVENDIKEIIEKIKSSYLLENLKSNISIPSVGSNGSSITVTTSDASIITSDGIITRGNNAKSAVLTITAQKNSAVQTAGISVTVAAKENGGTQISGGKSPKVSTVFGKGTISQSGIDITPDEPGNENKSVFADVDVNFWAYDDIKYLVDKQIMSGTGENNIEPERNVKREEFVKLLLGAMGVKSQRADNSFEDVDVNEWYAPYIAAARSKNIVSGYENGIFGIGESISRQDMAVLIYRAANLADIDDGDIFSDDSQIADYAKKAVYTLKNLEIIGGKGNNIFDALAGATRAEAARMLTLAMKKGLF